MKTILLLLLCFLMLSVVPAQDIQWATKLIDFSSEWNKNQSELSSNFKASQILGFPNTLTYGISELAWAPAGTQQGKESVTVGFAKPQYVQQVIIGETYNSGAVKEIILFDEKGKSYTVYENKLTAPKNNYGQVLIPYKISPTPYKVTQLKLILNTDNVGGMQQIDCIGISSSSAPVKLKVNEVLYDEIVGAPENLGVNINSEFYDHLPIISPDEQLLYFARKWAEDNTGKEQKDDIYFAYQLSNGAFTKAENIGSPLNTSEHNFVCFVSKDNNRLYLANRYKKNNMTGVSVATKQKDNTWSTPKSLTIPDMYNNNEYAHYHLSLDENVLLMCVERLDGVGDLDIFVSQRYTDGTWSKPQSLGNAINTVGAEASVFLAADGRTLFFSSAGHQGYGSYDMYVSKRLDNTWTNWSTPLNLGAKINSDQMDIYYTITANGEYAYFSSGKTYFGKNDLYRIRLPKAIRPEPVIINNPPLLVNSKIANSSTPTVTKPTTTTLPKQDSYQQKLDSLKKLSNPNSTPSTTINTTLTKLPEKPTTSTPTATTVNPYQQKLDSLKKLNNPNSTPSTTINTTLTKLPEKPTTSTPTATTVNSYQQKLDSLKKLNNQNSTPSTTINTTLTKLPESTTTTPKKDTLVNKNALPQSAVMQLAKQPNKYAVDSFKNIPKVANTDAQKNVFDNLKKTPEQQQNDAFETKQPTSSVMQNQPVVQTQQLPNSTIPQTIESPNKTKTTLNNIPIPTTTIESTPQTVPQTTASTNTTTPTLKPKEELTTDPYAQKLAQLKQSQSESKMNNLPQNGTTTEYSKYTEKKDYTDPTIDYSNKIDPQKNAMEQKLYGLNAPTTPQQSTKLPATTTTTQPQNQALKDKQEDKYAQDYNTMQDKIAQLKQQQQQHSTSSAPAPKKSEIKVDNSNPDIKYIPKETPTSAPTTTITSNPQLEKYQEKLKQIQDQMATIGTPVSNDTKMSSTTPSTTPTLKTNTPVSTDIIQDKIDALKESQEKIKSESIPTVAITTPDATITSSTTPTTAITTPYTPVNDLTDEEYQKQKQAIEELKQEQDKLNQQLNTTLGNLNTNKSSLEKDIQDLTQEREKLNQQLNSTVDNLNQNKNNLEQDIENLSSEKDKLNQQKSNLETTNNKLAQEKAQLETDKKKMDELLAQMKAEQDKLAAEKAKMEKDKQLLEQLRKQQEKEVMALSKNIDSLKKAQQQAIDANSKVQRYEIFQVPIEEGAIAIMKSIYFVADASGLQSKSFPELDKLVSFLKQNSKIKKIEIGGHTNGLCDDVFCNKLSNDRAKSVMEYLVKNGIPADKLSYKGYGKQYLIASPGDSNNQRVEVKIISVAN